MVCDLLHRTSRTPTGEAQEITLLSHCYGQGVFIHQYLERDQSAQACYPSLMKSMQILQCSQMNLQYKYYITQLTSVSVMIHIQYIKRWPLSYSSMNISPYMKVMVSAANSKYGFDNVMKQPFRLWLVLLCNSIYCIWRCISVTIIQQRPHLRIL